MKLILTILTLITLLSLALPAYADEPQYSGNSTPDPKEEYYRGVYDTCFWSMARSGMGKGEAVTACLYIAKWAEKSNWYEQPSEGWKGLEQLPVGWGNSA